MALPETASFSEFAVLAGCRKSYVTALRHDGRLVLTEDGKRVRVAESFARIQETEDPAKDGVRARHAAARGGAAMTPPAAPPAPAEGEDDDLEAPAQGSHASRRAKALADKAETDAAMSDLELRERIGKLFPADDVEHAIRSYVTTFRSALEVLPSKLAPELAAIADEGRLRVVLSEAIEHELEELARRFGSIARAGGAA